MSLLSASARQVRSIRRCQHNWVPCPGSPNCLVSLCFHFPVLLVATVWLSVLVALGWLLLQIDLLGTVSEVIIHRVRHESKHLYPWVATEIIFLMYSRDIIKF